MKTIFLVAILIFWASLGRLHAQSSCDKGTCVKGMTSLITIRVTKIGLVQNYVYYVELPERVCVKGIDLQQIEDDFIALVMSRSEVKKLYNQYYKDSDVSLHDWVSGGGGEAFMLSAEQIARGEAKKTYDAADYKINFGKRYLSGYSSCNSGNKQSNRDKEKEDDDEKNNSAKSAQKAPTKSVNQMLAEAEYKLTLLTDPAEIEVQKNLIRQLREGAINEARANGNTAKEKQLTQNQLTDATTEVFIALSKIQIPDADAERKSVGLSYAFNYYNDTRISYNILNDWGGFLLSYDMFLGFSPYDGWKYDFETEENVTTLISDGLIEPGDLVYYDFQDIDDNNHVYKYKQLRSFSAGNALGFGGRFNLTRSMALRVIGNGEFAIGTTNFFQAGYGAGASLEIGKLIFSVFHKTSWYTGISEGKSSDIIVSAKSNPADEEWITTREKSNGDSYDVYYTTSYSKAEKNLKTFNKNKLKYLTFSLRLKVR